ncbi:hypothetical protein Pmani_000613 [Petrolisthes manimaculis]|uniref:PiggyBac transposable element-derived protein domain-containing protein n=1 Tax=Petrolisthes manimaculis TaxID=1843537 RepID=A0AAE1U3R5_9EUCA|nr:hypothetical protein Pmani_019209 [Petrolisthes manimaculis]KAK4323896.1 hypothetical protein Pmani_005424 [Petrolisthes manimaculis]KAK4329012.1 hypothetical protein Pmani_000613 [Petrolisthes manimaculis]
MARQNSPDFQQLLDGYITEDLSDLETDEYTTEDESSERGESSDEQADDPCIAQQRKRTRGGEAVMGGPGGAAPTRVRGAAAGRNSSVKWDWSSTPFIPKQLSFDSSSSGISDACSVTDSSNELDFLREFFSDELLDMIVIETNRYAQQYLRGNVMTPRCRLANWTDTTRDEMYLFFCIMLLMSHNKKNRINDYWSKDEVYEQKIFGKLMSRDRFLQLLRVLHFTDNTIRVENDKLQKIRPVMEKLRNSFKTMFKPFQDLCVDESLMKWRGRLSFRQFLPLKRHRFGVKMFVLCDCDSGYISDFIVYTGKDTAIVEDLQLGVSGSVVKTLLTPHLQKAHIVYVDNWYTSPNLLHYLLNENTGACGTVRANRKNMPKLPVVKRGDQIVQHSNNIMCIKWCDKRVVHMLSSVHKGDMCDSNSRDRQRQVVRKPLAVLEYNKKMRLVDKSDMLLSSVECLRKSIKWYVKFFFHMLDMSVLNSYYLFQVKTGSTKPLLDFSKTVVHQMIEKYYHGRHHTNGQIGVHILRLVERHFVEPLPDKTRRRCHVCSHTTSGPRKTQRTTYKCRQCDVPLCVYPCFEAYHTQKNY